MAKISSLQPPVLQKIIAGHFEYVGYKQEDDCLVQTFIKDMNGCDEKYKLVDYLIEKYNTMDALYEECSGDYENIEECVENFQYFYDFLLTEAETWLLIMDFYNKIEEEIKEKTKIVAKMVKSHNYNDEWCQNLRRDIDFIKMNLLQLAKIVEKFGKRRPFYND